MKKWKPLLVVVLLLGLILSGCAGGGKQEPEGEEKTPEVAPQEVKEEDKFGGTFKGRLATDPPHLDPAFITDTTSSAVADNIFDGLVQYNKDLEVTPAIAKDWKMSEDGLTWRFNLRDDVKFHNGRKVTAEDVEYSFTRLVDPKTASPRAWLFESVEGVAEFQDGNSEKVSGFKVVDEKTFEIILSEPFTPFLSVLAMTNASIVPKEEVEKWGEDFTTHPVGTGAFKFKEWMHDDHVTLTANEEYFEGRPYLDQVEYRVIPEIAPAFAEYEQGGVYSLEEIPDGQIERVLNGTEFKDELIKKPKLGIYYFGMNVTKEPFDNVKVRQAIAHAINKEAIVKVLRHGTVITAEGILPPGMPGHNKDLKGLEYDPEKAKELLKEAGFEGGLPDEYELAYNTSKGHQMIAEAVQADLKKVGINVKLVNLEWGSYLTKLDQGDTQIFRSAWIGDYPDPDNFLYVLLYSGNAGSKGNSAFYKNEEFDEKVVKARGMEPGPERIQLYQEAEKIAIEDAPWVPIYYYTNLILRKPFVQDFKVTAFGVMPLKDVWLSDNK